MSTVIRSTSPSPEAGSSAVDHIKSSLIFYAGPQAIYGLRCFRTQRADVDLTQCLLDLSQGAGPYNDAIAMLRLQRTVVLHPSIRKICLGGTLLFRDGLPLLQDVKEALLVVQVVVDGAVWGRVVEATFALFYIFPRLDEETSRNRRVGEEALRDDLAGFNTVTGRELLTMPSSRKVGSRASSCFLATAE